MILLIGLLSLNKDIIIIITIIIIIRKTENPMNFKEINNNSNNNNYNKRQFETSGIRYVNCCDPEMVTVWFTKKSVGDVKKRQDFD